MQSSLVRTSLPATVRLEAGNGQLPCLRVSNGLAEAEIYLHGAHITAWTPKGQAPVLWVSRESAFEAAKPIRGGVPICFPWFGGHATEKAAPCPWLCAPCRLVADRRQGRREPGNDVDVRAVV